MILRGFATSLEAGAAMVLAATAAAPALGQTAEDELEIRNVMARYTWALDGKDAQTYSSIFAPPDGVLVSGSGEMRGREAIRGLVEQMRQTEQTSRAADSSGLRPARPRHFMANLVVEIDGERAKVKDYWFHLYNNNPERTPYVTSYGHAENELAKINGEWLIAYRRIYNEQPEDRWVRDDNPSFIAPPQD